MKVSYKIVGVGGWTDLSDDTGSAVYNLSDAWTPGYSQQNMETALFNSTRMARAPMGNVKCTIPFTFAVLYADPSAAIAALRLGSSTTPFIPLLGALFHIRVVESSGAVPETQYYPNAVVQSYTPRVQGSAVAHQFSFSSDLATNITPST